MIPDVNRLAAGGRNRGYEGCQGAVEAIEMAAEGIPENIIGEPSQRGQNECRGVRHVRVDITN